MSKTAIVEVEQITFDDTLLAVQALDVVGQEDPGTGDDDADTDEEDEEDVEDEDLDDEDESEDDDDAPEAV